MYMWRELDLGEIREDMSRISELGFDTVRVFALTMDFLPTSSTVDEENIARLVAVCSAAKDAGLKIVPTLIVINMSGHMWWPEWMLHSARRPRDLFSDAELLTAQLRLAQACASALSGDEAIRAFDLANEIDDAQRPQSRRAARSLSSLALPDRSDEDQFLESAEDQALAVERRRLRIHHVGQPRVLHDFGVNAIAMGA